MNIGIIGCWHQGVVGAACFADRGYDVLAADPDAARITALNEGRAPVFEPGLDALLQNGLKAGHLRFTADLREVVRGRHDILIMFDTPVDAQDRSDLSGFFAAGETIAPHLEPDTVILVTAQVPVGACDRWAATIRRVNSAASFAVAYSPENLRLGQALERFLHPPLPVIGADADATLDRVERLLAPLEAQWTRMNLRSAEMTKHALNAFLAVSVCFANELGNLCEEVGADGHRIAEALRREPRIGSKALLVPGLGFSGGTLARDMQTLRGLGDHYGFETPLLDGAWAGNVEQNRWVLRKLCKECGDLTGRPIAVWGLTYKPGTSTLRRSVALDMIADLVAAGMQVRAHDPKADRAAVAAHPEFRFEEDPYAAVSGAQALAVITAWPEYRTLDFKRIRQLMSGTLILDVNGMLDGAHLRALGFTYRDIGRG